MPDNRPGSRRRFSLAAAALGLIVTASNAYAQPVLVSTSSDGTAGNGAPLSHTAIDDSGRYVVFADASTNLVTGDANGSIDVFVKDRTSNATTRVSVGSDGTERAGDSGTTGLDVSGDGQVVVFTSTAALVPNDTNNCGDSGTTCQDIYVHDRRNGQTTRVSVATGGTQANARSEWPSISRNGRYITFTSYATNLVPTDTNDASDIFVHDRVTGTTTRVSVSTAGIQGASGQHSLRSRISADGNIVSFLSSATLTNEPHPFGCVDTACYDAFVHDLSSAATIRVPLDIEKELPQARPPSRHGVTVLQTVLDASGRWVALLVSAVSTEFPLTPRRVSLIYDRVSGRTLLVDSASISSPGPALLALSGDGTVVESNIFYYSRTGFSLVRLDRTTGHVLRSASGELFQADDLSFSGDVGVGPRFEGIYAYDYDRDHDHMRDDWERTFGLDLSVDDSAADPDEDGLTNLQEHEAGSHPRGMFKRYLAEGAANAFFTTRLAIANPNAEQATVSLQFLGTSGLQSALVEVARSNERRTLTLTPQTNIPENDFSTLIESDRPVVVDRTMTWDASTGIYGGHAETAIESPSTNWYFAEGATHGAFSLFYLLQNPNDADANVTVNYLRLAPQTPVAKTYTVPRKSRRTIQVDSEGPELEATDVAARIVSDVPIIAERAMYATFAGQPPFAAGHGGAAVPATALKWFLAEGATGPFFDLYVLVANPNPDGSNLKVTYLFPEGEPLVKNYSVGPNDRLTISVDTEDPRLENTPVSIVVESINDEPVVVERAMWWPSPNWYEAHLSAGTTTAGTKWALAEGENTFNVETYILIANTGDTDGTATVSFLQEGSMFGLEEPIQITVPLKANSRTNVRPADISGLSGWRFGTVVESDGVPIVVERAMYQTVNGVIWSVGTSAVATKLQ